MSEPTSLLLSYPSVPGEEVWTSVVGQYPPIAKRIYAFTDPLTRAGMVFDQPSPYDLPVNWAIVYGAAYCQNYLIRAYKHRRDFLAVTAEMKASELSAANRTHGSELIRYWEQSRRAIIAHGEIEELYFCLKLLVDRLATVFSFYFSLPLPKPDAFGSSHYRLVKMIENGHPALSPILKSLSSSLLPQMVVLKERVSQFRNTEIEHVKNPHTGMTPTVWWEDANDQNRVAALISSDMDGAFRTTEDPTVLIDLVERYFGETLDFLTAHRNISVLKSPRF